MIPVRKDEVSYSFFIISSNSMMNIVGTPCTAVQHSFSIVSSTLTGSNTTSGTIVAPAAMQVIVPNTQPKQ